VTDDVFLGEDHYRLFGPELKRWVLAAIGLRLILMPIVGHYDLLYAYGYSARLISGTIDWAQMDADHAAYLLHTVVLKMLQPFVKTFILSGGTVGIDEGTWGFWHAYARNPEIFRAFALFKLPYLGFDILSAWLLLRVIGRDSRAVSAVKLWLFNPITIFVTYMFGRFDIMAVPFLLGSILSLKNRKTGLAGLLFGMCVAIRFYYILFVPAYAVIASHKWRGRTVVLFFALFPIVLQTTSLAAGVFPLAFPLSIVILALLLSREGLRRHEIAVLIVSFAGALTLLFANARAIGPALSHSGFGMVGYALHPDFPFRAKLELWRYEIIYPVFVLYGIFVFYAVGLKRWRLNSFAALFAIFLLSYYSFSFFHPQYLVVLAASVVLASAWNESIVKPHLVQCFLALLLVFNYGVHPTNYLFAPFAPDAVFSSAGLLSLVEAKLGAIGTRMMIGVPRSLFVGASFWMIWQLLKTVRDVEETRTSAE